MAVDSPKKLRRPFTDVAPSDETRQVPIAEGQWVELKLKLAYGERKKLERFAFQINMQGPAPSIAGMSYDFALEFQQALKLAIYIVDWNLTDRKGRPVQIPDDPQRRVRFFLDIDADLGDSITEEIDAIQAERLAAVAAEIEGELGNGGTASPNGSIGILPSTTESEPSPTSPSAAGWAAGPSAS